MTALISKVFDVFQGPRLFEFFWHFLVGVSRLTDVEIKSASLVLGEGTIKYRSVRVAEGRLLNLIFKFNKGRAFTTFHTVNLPLSGIRRPIYRTCSTHTGATYRTLRFAEGVSVGITTARLIDEVRRRVVHRPGEALRGCRVRQSAVMHGVPRAEWRQHEPPLADLGWSARRLFAAGFE